MELTAKEILEKHKLIVAKRYGHSDWVLFANNASEENLLNGISEAGIAATKEVVELAWENGHKRGTAGFSGKNNEKQEFINSLFPESK
jgi:hypothetical protein